MEVDKPDLKYMLGGFLVCCTKWIWIGACITSPETDINNLKQIKWLAWVSDF